MFACSSLLMAVLLTICRTSAQLPESAEGTTAHKTPPQTAEARDWHNARLQNTLEGYLAFLHDHPDGPFSREACSFVLSVPLYNFSDPFGYPSYELGETVMSELQSALDSPNHAIRSRAANWLFDVNDYWWLDTLDPAIQSRFLDPLIVALKDEDRFVRWAARDALCSINDPSPVKALIAALWDGESSKEVTSVLLRRKDASAVEPLIARLNAGGARQSAASVLGAIGDPRAVEPLIAAMRDGDWDVQKAAASALGAIGDPRAVELLIGALRGENSDVRQSAALALGAIGDPRAFEPLLAALKDGDSDVRRSAARALGDIKDPRAVEPLIAAMKDGDWFLRKAAAKALVAIKNPRAVEPLIAALKDDVLPCIAAEALGGLRGIGVFSGNWSLPKRRFCS